MKNNMGMSIEPPIGPPEYEESDDE
jgi:hypothetical protein